MLESVEDERTVDLDKLGDELRGIKMRACQSPSSREGSKSEHTGPFEDAEEVKRQANQHLSEQDS